MATTVTWLATILIFFHTVQIDTAPSFYFLKSTFVLFVYREIPKVEASFQLLISFSVYIPGSSNDQKTIVELHFCCPIPVFCFVFGLFPLKSMLYLRIALFVFMF